MGSAALWLAAVLQLVLLVGLVEAQSSAAPVKYSDPFCQLTGVPARDPAEVTRIYLTRQNQTCNLLVPQDGDSQPTVGTLHYVRCGSVTTYCSWRIQSGVVRISAANLDKGVAPSSVSYQYIHRIDDSVKKSGVSGLVLGQKLGGSGTVLQNLFPQSPVMQTQWQAHEQQIYDCLAKKQATYATLRWYFRYRTKTSSRPYEIYYSASFSEPNGASSECASLSKHFDN